jgi:putative transposase
MNAKVSKVNMENPKRKANRLDGYDYSQNGAYFITICINERKQLLWEKVRANFVRPDGNPQFSNIGLIIDNEINRLSIIYKNVSIDKYVIMPNHIHLIIVLQDESGWRPKVAPTISRIVKQFKGTISKKIGSGIWQKSFHDHIIRNYDEYKKIWQYIDENQLKWQEDCYYNIKTVATQGRFYCE